jgi:osmotically-inducible protein OsmY
MAPTLVKTTGKTLKKSAQVKAVTKTAKGARKTATKAIKASAVTKAAKKAASNVGDGTRRGAALGAGAATAAGGYLFFRRRRRSADDAGRSTGDLNDPALARKVESEIFRPADAPKDKVNVNVEHGVVFLRGEVASREQADALASAAGSVEGVKRVENLLHTSDEPAPAKSESHDSVERPVG